MKTTIELPDELFRRAKVMDVVLVATLELDELPTVGSQAEAFLESC